MDPDETGCRRLDGAAAEPLKLWYLDGSPFARITRATLIEFGIPHDAVELTGFPPQGIEDLSPAWQVPILEHDGQRLFGTDLIRRYLHDVHGPASAELSRSLARPDRRWHDLQTLGAVQSMTEAIVSHHYALWSGTPPLDGGKLGVDPAQRNMARALSLLDWLEARIEGDWFWGQRFSAADLALGAAILWTEAREPIDWRGRPAVERVVARCAQRPSMIATAPKPLTGYGATSDT